ncbi:sugar-binding transcriptional regulator [Microbacterium sp. LWO12-1.2]|uniref:sugar-binding transcriptional regulator n=1 Tax=Microbacterium sp. LWO12-1.2 TaxID=3135261 RepID=UPI003430DF2D
MLMGRVARMYYELGLTHQEIADTLGLSRVRVTRLLAEARESGMVEIIVHVEESLFAAEEQALLSRFGLRQAWIAPSIDDPAKAARAMATVGVEALASVIEKDTTVAMGLSTAVAAVVEAFPTRSLGARFVPLTGSSSGLANGASPHELTLALARRTGGAAFHLPAPLVAASAQAAESAYADPGVRDVLARAAEATTVIAGIGSTQDTRGLLFGSLSEEERAALLEAGAIGDIGGRFFDATGAPVRGALDHRVVGLDLDQLRAIPHRLAIAAGPAKLDALRVALSSGLVTMLVTDSTTAAGLLG